MAMSEAPLNPTAASRFCNDILIPPLPNCLHCFPLSAAGAAPLLLRGATDPGTRPPRLARRPQVARLDTRRINYWPLSSDHREPPTGFVSGPCIAASAFFPLSDFRYAITPDQIVSSSF